MSLIAHDLVGGTGGISAMRESRKYWISKEEAERQD